MQVYAPVNEATDDNEFYEQLQGTVHKCKKRDVAIAIWTLNAKSRDDNNDVDEIMGKHGNGSWMIMVNDFLTFGQWSALSSQEQLPAPTEKLMKQLACHLTIRHVEVEVEDTRVYSRADAASEHYLVK